MKSRLEGGAPLAAYAILILLASASCTGVTARRPTLLHPLPSTEEGYALSRGSLLYEGDSFLVTVRPVDWREIGSCYVLGHQGIREELAAAGHIYFTVRLENISAGSLTFEPNQAEAVTERGIRLTRSGFGEGVVRDRPPAGGDAAAAPPIVLHADPAATAVYPGGTMEGLLVFEVPREKATAVTLHLGLPGAGFSDRALRFRFEAFPGTADDLP